MKMTYNTMTYSEFMMALCIWREARGEPAEGKIAVGEVIRNRMQAEARWRNTIAGVVTQPKQFSAFNAGDPNATKFPDQYAASWLDCCDAARGVLADHPEEDIAKGANHYHTKAVEPYWAKGETPVCEIRNHIFYKL